MFSKLMLAAAPLVLAACASATPNLAAITELPSYPAIAFAEDEAAISPERLRSDFADLYEGLQEAHYDLYARRSRAAYDALYEEVLASLDQPLRRSEAAILFQRFVAFGNIAHATIGEGQAVWARYRQAGGRALPVYPSIRSGKVLVSDSYDPGVLPGDEILAINGEPISDWLPRLGRNISADNSYLEGSLLEFFLPYALWLEIGEVDSVELRLRRQDGQEAVVDVATISSAELSARPSVTGEEVFAFDGYARSARVLEGGIAYLQPGPFYWLETPENPWTTEQFHTFIDESFEDFQKQGADAVLIDLRNNPGGTNSFSDRMVAWIADEPFRFYSEFLVRSSAQSKASNQARIDLNPESADGDSGFLARAFEETPFGETFPLELPFARPERSRRFTGEVFVLIDRYSFSNAANVAAIIQDYGFGLIIGEETSDLATTYGAMETFTLQETGITVGYPKALIVRPSGDLSDRGVVPDIALEPPLFSSRDEMLEDALEVIRSRSK